MVALHSPGKAKTLPTGRVNAGVAAQYDKRLRLLIRRMHRDTLRTIQAHYRRAEPELAQDNAPDDQPRDRYGRWVAEGGSERQSLQDRHKELLDRLEKEDASPPPYGKMTWNMPETGYDTRQEPGIKRALVLGEIAHPDDASKHVPIILREGSQKTSKPNGKGHGRRHIEFRHGQELRDLGFNDALDAAHYIVKHHTSDIQARHSRNLEAALSGPNGQKMIEALHLMEDGDHYRVATVFPRREQ